MSETTIDYLSIAGSIVETSPPPVLKTTRIYPVQSDFDVEPPEGEDLYQPGFFAPGTFVSHIRSDSGPEAGLYNVLLYASEANPPTWFHAPVFLLSTHGYHPQSAPVRPSYLIHAYRLLLAVEQLLGTGKKVFAVYDCGEDSGVNIGHKCVRFYITESDTVEPRLPSKTHPLPSGLTLEARAEELGDIFQRTLREHVPQSPPYNMYVTRDKVIIVERVVGSKGKIEEYGSGLWDGARLVKNWS